MAEDAIPLFLAKGEGIMRIVDDKQEEKPRLIEPTALLKVKSGTAPIYFMVIEDVRGKWHLLDLRIGVILDHEFNHAKHVMNFLQKEYDGFELITGEEYEVRIL